jgi:hypothetical protein
MVLFLAHLEEEQEQLPAATPERQGDVQRAEDAMLSVSVDKCL